MYSDRPITWIEMRSVIGSWHYILMVSNLIMILIALLYVKLKMNSTILPKIFHGVPAMSPLFLDAFNFI
jgi:hypothetical protein